MFLLYELVLASFGSSAETMLLCYDGSSEARHSFFSFDCLLISCRPKDLSAWGA